MIRASMRPPFGRRIPLLLVAAASALPPAAPSVAPSAADLGKLQTARNVGLASLEEGNLGEAGKRFDEVRRLAPAEPLGWADGAVTAMRGKDLASAGKLLAEASRLAPADPRVAALAGVLAEQDRKTDAAIEAYERAAAGDSKDLPSRWGAARLLAEKPGARPRAIRALEGALEQAPANLFLLLRLSELRRAEGDRAGAEAALEKAVQESGGTAAGDDKLERYTAEAKAAFAAGDLTAAALKSRVVENLLRTSARYQQSRQDVEPGVVGLPLEDWTPSLAEKIRARPASIPVRFVARKDEALAALSDLADVRVSGVDSRDLAFAGAAGVVVARGSEGL